MHVKDYVHLCTVLECMPSGLCTRVRLKRRTEGQLQEKMSKYWQQNVLGILKRLILLKKKPKTSKCMQINSLLYQHFWTMTE